MLIIIQCLTDWYCWSLKKSVELIYSVAQKIGNIFIHLNFTKYKPIFKIILLSESEENL